MSTLPELDRPLPGQAPRPAGSGRCRKRRRRRRSRRRRLSDRSRRPRRGLRRSRRRARRSPERSRSWGPSTRAAEGRTTASPIIIAAISRVVSSPTLPPPTLAPRRSTLTSSQKASTSRNLWVIISAVISPRCAIVLEEAEDFVGFAGRQHRSRLVENEEALVEIEQLQDFQLLLFARRERGDGPVERHAKRHAREKRFERLALLAPIDEGGRVGAARRRDFRPRSATARG